MMNTLPAEFAAGLPWIVIDDSKEKEHAAMVCLAELAEPEVINQMIKHAGGIVSVAMTPDMALRAELQRQHSGFGHDTNYRHYTISIDADETTTGISAFERSFSIKKLASTGTSRGFKKPGHIFPVVSHPDRLFGTTSVVEAALELAALSGKPGMAVICDLLDFRGELADGAHAQRLAKQLRIPCIYVSGILTWRIIKEGLLTSRKTTGVPVNGQLVNLFSYTLHHSEYHLGYPVNLREKVRQELDASQRQLEASYPKFNPVTIDMYQTEDTWMRALNRISNGYSAIMFDSGAEKMPPLMTNLVYQMIVSDVKRDLSSFNDQIQPAANE